MNNGLIQETFVNHNNSTAFKRNDIETFINNLDSNPIQNIYNNDVQTNNINQIPSLEFGDLNLKSNSNNVMSPPLFLNLTDSFVTISIISL